jgi:hypothetical protein
VIVALHVATGAAAGAAGGSRLSALVLGLFHDRLGWHRSGRFPAALQVLLAGAILGALSVSRRRDGPAAEDLLSATGWRTNRLNDRGASEENDEQSRLERRLLVLMRHNLRQLRKHVDWHRERLQ